MKASDGHCTRPPELRPGRTSALTAVVAHEVRENRGQVLHCVLLRDSVTVMWTKDHISHILNTLSHIQTKRQLASMWSGFERRGGGGGGGRGRGKCSGGEGKGSWMYCCWAAVEVVLWTVQRED